MAFDWLWFAVTCIFGLFSYIFGHIDGHRDGRHEAINEEE